MMKIGIMYEQSDIVLVPVPFTDLSSQRRWPVIIISNNDYNQKTNDLVVVAMTSNPVEVDYSFTITSSDLVQGQLNRPGKVRVDKIYTLSQSIIVKKFGQVDINVLNKIRHLLQSLTVSSTSTRIF
jgi:mRNA interferase MazF